MSAGHAENEHFTYDVTSKLKTKFLGNSLDVYPLGRLVFLCIHPHMYSPVKFWCSSTFLAVDVDPPELEHLSVSILCSLKSFICARGQS